VLLNNMGGLAQIDCMKQFVQFGMAKDMALGGALFELESVKSVPKEAQAGWWDMEWWWDQPGVPHVAEFVADVRNRSARADGAALVRLRSRSTASSWPPKRRSPGRAEAGGRAGGHGLPPEIALQPGKVIYRKGDHQLMPTSSPARSIRRKGNPDNVFTVAALVPGEEAAGRVADTGCKMTYPS
jgi:branched-chain amino acid transport system substrate-binding protein